MIRFIHWCLIVLFSFLNTGYPDGDPQDAGSLVVTEIRVVTTSNGQTHTHTVTDDKTMTAILNYLRLSEAYGVACIDPDTFRTDICQIIVCRLNGSHSTYRQIHNEYLQKNDGQWLRIHGSNLLFPQL